jgi:hypothetical protein
MKRAIILGLMLCLLLLGLSCAPKSVEEKAIEIAVNDPEVMKYLDGGYYKDKIEVTPGEPPWDSYYPEELREVRIPIKIKKRDRWISSAVVVAEVNLDKEKVIGVGLDVQLVPLTEEEKEAALQIALDDPRVSGEIARNQEKYGISCNISVEVNWRTEEINRGKKRLLAFPTVYFEPEVSGYATMTVDVDLDEKRVTEMGYGITPLVRG